MMYGGRQKSRIKQRNTKNNTQYVPQVQYFDLKDQYTEEKLRVWRPMEKFLHIF